MTRYTEDSWRLSATQLAASISSGQLSAEQAARDALARLENINPTINAVVDYRPEDVIARAQDIDARLSRGETLGPLAGVPVTVKVNVDQEGYATTHGVHLNKNLVAHSNSPVVQRFLDADAVILGRTNTPAFSYRWFTNNLLHGHTYNPRNRLLTPGGSSGGAGSAVAAGIGAIAHGTDIAGSVRFPAYACGVHGLRPSLGRVATFNASAPERNIGGQLMSVSGPLARSIADIRVAIEVMSAPDSRDPWWRPSPLQGNHYRRHAVVCLQPDNMGVAPELKQALLEAADQLRDAGWIVDEVDSLPPIASAVPIQKTLWLGEQYEKLLEQAYQEGDPGALHLLESNRDFFASRGPDALSQALIQRATIVREWQQFTERYPLVLLPPCGELPFADNLDLSDLERVWTAQAPMIALPLTGLPSMSVATGIVKDNIPIGVQLVSRVFREDICLEAAEAIEARSPAVTIAEPERHN
ncbi:Acylamidase [Halomonadaceae bacterium LMG 33818]|uniref:amidase family protein n=1 Tax=Cernens ardua TaxID=3402176 RepID=UPI003EDC753C